MRSLETWTSNSTMSAPECWGQFQERRTFFCKKKEGHHEGRHPALMPKYSPSHESSGRPRNSTLYHFTKNPATDASEDLHKSCLGGSVKICTRETGVVELIPIPSSHIEDFLLILILTLCRVLTWVYEFPSPLWPTSRPLQPSAQYFLQAVISTYILYVTAK